MKGGETAAQQGGQRGNRERGQRHIDATETAQEERRLQLDPVHLLHQLAHTLFQSKVTIHSSHVATYGERAVDTFYLTDLTGDKVSGSARLKTLERRLLDAAAGVDMMEPA